MPFIQTPHDMCVHGVFTRILSESKGSPDFVERCLFWWHDLLFMWNCYVFCLRVFESEKLRRRDFSRQFPFSYDNSRQNRSLLLNGMEQTDIINSPISRTFRLSNRICCKIKIILRNHFPLKKIVSQNDLKNCYNDFCLCFFDDRTERLTTTTKFGEKL